MTLPNIFCRVRKGSEGFGKIRIGSDVCYLEIANYDCKILLNRSINGPISLVS